MSARRFSNVFVLCTGRCGSLTLERACQHIDNFSCAHESRCDHLGTARLDYPANHIEIDNRLSWFLWQLENRFGNDAVYVHLRRDVDHTAKSYHARWYNRGSILRAYARGILKRDDTATELSVAMVNHINDSIDQFLKNKSHTVVIDIENPSVGFRTFWRLIGAEGDFEAAQLALQSTYNHQGVARDFSDQLNRVQAVDPLVEAEDKLQGAMLSLVAERSRAEAATDRHKTVKAENADLRSQNRNLAGRLNRIETSRAFRLSLAMQACRNSPLNVLKFPIEAFGILSGKVSQSALLPDSAAKAPSDLTVQASDLTVEQGVEAAVELLQRYPSALHRKSAPLLRANASLADEQQWLVHVNEYLAEFDLSPLELSPSDGYRFLGLRSACKQVRGDALVTVLMPVFNAKDTLALSIQSLLAQSWQSLEIIAVDDCSSDGSLELLQELARQDSRITVLSNSENVGPYVSKNRALSLAKGRYVTNHDADDWAHPQRLERQIRWMRDTNASVCIGGMLRMQLDGLITRFCRSGSQSHDGASRTALISAMFDRDVLSQRLGYWDSVRFAADSELVARAVALLGESAVYRCHDPLMLCLDSPTGLTADPESGVDPRTGVSDIRARYRDSWLKWHQTLTLQSSAGVLPFPLRERAFAAPSSMRVSLEQVQKAEQSVAVVNGE